jgi:hypothetical protein
VRRSSVSDVLAADERRRVAALSVGERVRLALELGERSLAAYCSASGLDRDDARRGVERRRQARRRRSACLKALLA